MAVDASTSAQGDLILKNLTKTYGDFKAVDGIDFTVRRGESFGLLGPNGAGKTSTVLGISGVIEPAFGEIWLDGVDMVGMDADEIRRRGVATVPEGHQVLRELTVRDNLLVAGGSLSRGEVNASDRKSVV